jgi:AcrR family transcriptional regulator
MSNTVKTRKEQSLKTKENILDAALVLFSERGFDGVSLRDIGERAGVNHAMIRYYFTNKMELWKHANDYLFSRLSTDLQAPYDPELSELDRAKSFIRRYVRYCAAHPEHARIMLQESIGSEELLKTSVPHIKEQHENSKEPFKRWMDAGIIPEVSIVSLIYCIVGMSQLPFALSSEVKLVHGIDIYDDKEIESHCDTVLKLLFRE